jgi:Uma2 family endonuclease
MNVALRKPMTLPQFLAWEERQELRYEFDGFRPVAMPDVTIAHDIIGNALRALLGDRLRGTPYRVRGPTLKIEVELQLTDIYADVQLALQADSAAADDPTGSP